MEPDRQLRSLGARWFILAVILLTASLVVAYDALRT